VRLSKRYAALVVLVPAALALLVTTRPWVVGESRDVLSAGTTEVTGGAAAPGVVGLVVVAVVALLGLMTGGRIIRAVSGVVLVVAAAGATALTLLVVLRPVDAVSAAVAKELARTTAPDATGTATAWGWVAVVVMAALLVGAVAAALSSRSWAGLSSRYDRGSRPDAGPRGQVRNAWDELSEGGDPTLRDAPDQT
jgi:Tryptophan-associated transmembrane protein (Trp_oprn_chp)